MSAGDKIYHETLEVVSERNVESRVQVCVSCEKYTLHDVTEEAAICRDCGRQEPSEWLAD